MSDAIYPVPSAWAEAALIDAARYQAMYAHSVAEPEAFWREEAQRIDWIRPFTKVKNASFREACDSPGSPSPRLRGSRRAMTASVLFGALLGSAWRRA